MCLCVPLFMMLDACSHLAPAVKGIAAIRSSRGDCGAHGSLHTVRHSCGSGSIESMAVNGKASASTVAGTAKVDVGKTKVDTVAATAKAHNLQRYIHTQSGVGLVISDRL